MLTNHKCTYNALKGGKNMKFKHVLLALTASLAMGIGALALASSGEAKQAKAADGDKYIYFSNGAGWSNVYCYYWGGTGGPSWPGTQMEKVYTNGYSEDVYRIKYDVTDHTNLIFNNGAQTPTQTGDSTLASVTHKTNNGFYFNGSGNAAGTWDCVPAYTLNGTFEGSGWNEGDGVAFTVSNDGVATLTQELHEDDEFKIKLFDQWTKSLGYAAIASESQGLFTEEGGNVKVSEDGIYTFTFDILEEANIVVEKAAIPAPSYFVRIANGEYAEMTYSRDFTYGDNDEHTGKEYTLDITATAGQKLFFRKGASQTIEPGASDGSGTNNLFWNSSNNEITVVQDATNKTLTLRTYEDGGYDTFLAGYVAAPSTYYFTNNQGWEGTPYIYVFNANSTPKVAYPGEAMTYVDIDKNGQQRYSFTVDTDKYPNFIINNGINGVGGDQTVDLQFASYMKDGFYLNEREDNKWTVSAFDYAAVVRSVYVGGVEYALNPSASQPGGDVLLQLETVAIDMRGEDQIRYKVDSDISDANLLEPYYTNNAAYYGSNMHVLVDATAKVYVKLMSDSSVKIFVMGSTIDAQGYHLIVNGATIIEMTHGSEFDGFDQYYSDSVGFKKDDVIRFVDVHSGENNLPVLFDITTINAAGLGGNFKTSAGKLVADKACSAQVYLKLKYEHDEVYFGDVPEYVAEARDYAIAFNDAIEAVCDDDGITTVQLSLEEAWAAQATAFEALSDEAKDEITGGSTTVQEIKDMIAKYDSVYRLRKLGSDWGLDNFLHRTYSPAQVPTVHYDTNALAIMAVVGIVVITLAAAGLIFIRKRQSR